MTAAEPTPGWVPPDDPFGAFCRHNHVALEGAQSGPLAGLTFAVKDIFAVKGTRTGFGHPDWLRTHPPATETAELIERLLAAGAHMVARAHTDEMAYSLTGENVHYGTPLNPWDAARIPGGSSSGSAVAVAAGLVDFSIGTDCGGSVRLPASYLGILGIRPTHGSVSLDGAVSFAPSFDCAGWFARSGDIFEAVGRVLLPAGEPQRPRRLLLARDAFDLVNESVREALAPAVAILERHVAPVEEVIVSPDGLRTWFETFRVLQAAEIWANHGEWITATRPEFGPGIRERFEWAAAVPADSVAEAKARHRDVIRRLGELLQPGDVLCLPSSPRVAPLRNTTTDTLEIEYRHQAMCLLCIAGLGGLPQVNLPLALLGGLPIGLSIVGPRGADLDLLRVASEVCPGVYCAPSG